MAEKNSKEEDKENLNCYSDEEDKEGFTEEIIRKIKETVKEEIKEEIKEIKKEVREIKTLFNETNERQLQLLKALTYCQERFSEEIKTMVKEYIKTRDHIREDIKVMAKSSKKAESELCRTSGSEKEKILEIIKLIRLKFKTYTVYFGGFIAYTLQLIKIGPPQFNNLLPICRQQYMKYGSENTFLAKNISEQIIAECDVIELSLK